MRMPRRRAVLEEPVLPEVVRDVEVVVAVVVRVAGFHGEAPAGVSEAGSRRFVHKERMPVPLHVPEETAAHAVHAVVRGAGRARVAVARHEEIHAPVAIGVEEHGGRERSRKPGETPVLRYVAELPVAEVLQEAARRDVIREEKVRQPVPVEVGGDAAGGFHLRQEVESRAGRRVAEMARSVVQEEPRMPVRDDHVHETVPVDVHEQHSRMVVRRGQAEVRGLDRIEGFVRSDETARSRFLEEMRGGALEDGKSVHGERGAQLPMRFRGGFGGFPAKEREIEDGVRGDAFGRILARPALQSDFDANRHVRRGFLLKVGDPNGRRAAGAACASPAFSKLSQRQRSRRLCRCCASSSSLTF